MKGNHTLVLGIGNQIMGDDGVGGHAALLMAVETAEMPDVSCLDGGTLGYLLANHIQETDNLIVIDAAQMYVQPGEFLVFENEEMDHFLSTNPNRSVHEVGLSDLLDMALLSDHLPKHRALIAIQPENTNIGLELSDPVSKSLPLVCGKALELINCWRVSMV